MNEPSLLIEVSPRKPMLLDCFCGMGGVSDGFALEGFDVTGIDVVDAPKMLGYKHRFIQADMLALKGEDFKGYDVIWGSPPCRHWSWIAFGLGHRWKEPPNIEKGLQLVHSYIRFANEAKPTFWVMENVSLLTRHLKMKPRFIAPLGIQMRRAFWGNFLPFLLPRSSKKLTERNFTGGMSHMRINGKIPKNEQWERAKIPLACSRAFARACKEPLKQ